MTPEIHSARAAVIGRVDSGDGHPDLIRNEYDARFTDMPDGFEMQYDSRTRMSKSHAARAWR